MSEWLRAQKIMLDTSTIYIYLLSESLADHLTNAHNSDHEYGNGISTSSLNNKSAEDIYFNVHVNNQYQDEIIWFQHFLYRNWNQSSYLTSRIPNKFNDLVERLVMEGKLFRVLNCYLISACSDV